MRMLTTEQQEHFTQLWTQAQSTVASFVHTSIRDRGQAEDLLQEIAMTLLRKFADYDSSKAFLPWAMGVAKFAILGSRRDYARSRLVFDEALLERIPVKLIDRLHKGFQTFALKEFQELWVVLIT